MATVDPCGDRSSDIGQILFAEDLAGPDPGGERRLVDGPGRGGRRCEFPFDDRQGVRCHPNRERVAPLKLRHHLFGQVITHGRDQLGSARSPMVNDRQRPFGRVSRDAEQIEQVVFVLGDAPPDGCQLNGSDVAIEVPVGLYGADQTPSQSAGDDPPTDVLI